MHQLIFSGFIKPIIPELIMIVSSMICLLVSIFKKNIQSTKWHAIFAIVAILIAVICLRMPFYYAPITAFDKMFISDLYITFSKGLILLVSIIFFIIYLNQHYAGKFMTDKYEFSVVAIFSIIGMMIMLSANDLLVMYLGIELQSLCLYVLAAFNRDQETSSEAGIKYFVLGALASGLLLYGISLIYGFSGSTSFTVLSRLYLINTGEINIPIGILIGVIFVVIGLSFKIAAVPFHMWAPDVYEGAPVIVTTFFATVPKLASVLFLIKFLIKICAVWVEYWQQMLMFFAVMSMVIGALGAIYQNNIKRLLAYSSINHIGYILLGISLANINGIQSSLMYLLVYVVMNLGVFVCIIHLKKEGVVQENIKEWSGLSSKNPLLAFSLLILMFSQAGIPPIAGFFAKFYIFTSVIKEGYYFLAIIAAITSVISAYYYLRIVKIMYFDTPTRQIYRGFLPEGVFVIFLIVLFNVVFFLISKPLLIITLDVTRALIL
ncbi:MAG: NADH-quinone oxidoreductase subunit NuoN [Rickettsiales endosymbiont of Dermacentor nuttalli]